MSYPCGQKSRDYSTLYVMLNVDPETLQQDADVRFTKGISSKVHRCMFYDRYLQECNARLEAGNTFLESEIEGDADEVDKTSPRVRAIRANIFMKQGKKRAIIF